MGLQVAIFNKTHFLCRATLPADHSPLTSDHSAPLCFLRCLLFGSQRLTEANEANEEEIPAPKTFVPRQWRKYASHLWRASVCRARIPAGLGARPSRLLRMASRHAAWRAPLPGKFLLVICGPTAHAGDAGDGPCPAVAPVPEKCHRPLPRNRQRPQCCRWRCIPKSHSVQARRTSKG